jgi:hypothetical protein
MIGAISPLLQYAFMALCLIKKGKKSTGATLPLDKILVRNHEVKRPFLRPSR